MSNHNIYMWNKLSLLLSKDVSIHPLTAPLLSLLRQLGFQSIPTTDPAFPNTTYYIQTGPPPTYIIAPPIIIFVIVLALALATLTPPAHGLYVRVLARATGLPAPSPRSHAHATAVPASFYNGVWALHKLLFAHWLLEAVLARLFVPRVLARVVAELLMVRWAQQVTRSYLGLGLVEGWLGAEGVVKPSTLVEGTLGVKGAVEESSGAKGILELLGTYMSRVMAQTMFGWHYGASHAPERVGILGCGVSVVVMVVFILVRLAVGEYLGEMLAMMVVLRAVAWEYWGGWKLAGATVVLSWLIVREQVGTRVGGMTWWMIMFEGVFGVFLTRALVLYIWA